MSTFLERFHRYIDDRGMMANLRCALVENKKQRAWPVLSRFGIDIKDNVAVLISGLFATHPNKENSIGNFGATCKAIEQKRGDKRGDDNKLTPTERRFQHLLSAQGGAELHDRVVRMVLMAKSQNVPVNYDQLKKDLYSWNDRTKIEWATAFWTPGVVPATEEEA
jgi:CRISPR system Cascade subunit CasB